MMSLFKYVVYAILMIVLYLVSKEFYNSNFNNERPVSKVEEQVVIENKNLPDTVKMSVKDFAN